MTQRFGLTPPVEVAGFAAAVDLCARAEQLGYTDVWSAEVGAVDAFTPRGAVAGRRGTLRGETVRGENFRLQIDPGAPVPIHVGALGPEMCRLAGRIADGVLLYFFTPDGVRGALEHVHAGAKEAGRDPDDLDVFIRLPAAVDEPE